MNSGPIGSRHQPTKLTGELGKRTSRRLHFPGGNGWTLSAILDMPEVPGRAPLVVFSHCFTCNKDLKAIVRLSRYLSERGIAVLRYDMTGLGGSEGRFRDTNFTTNIADLWAAIQFAESEIGSVDFLLGHSLGGAASLAAAGQWPRDRAPLSGVATLAAPSDTKHLADLLIRMDSRVEKEGRGEVTIGGRRWETTTQLIENLKHFDLPAIIARIRTQALLFHSPVDETVGYDHAIRILSWIGTLARGGSGDHLERPQPEMAEKKGGHGPIEARPNSSRASLITLPDADHLLTRNPRDLEFIGDMLVSWMRRHWQ